MPYTRLLDAAVKELPSYLKGSWHDSAQSAYDYLNEVGGCYGHLDVQVFDAHVSSELLHVTELKVLAKSFGSEFETAYANLTANVNRVSLGKGPARWTWELVGSRKSGETTTSTCNFLICQLIFKYACEKLGVAGRMVSVGDDAIVKMPDPR